MEVALPKLPGGVVVTEPAVNTKRNADKTGVESFAAAVKAKASGEPGVAEESAVKAKELQDEQKGKDELQDLLKHTAELLSISDRSLKFEMVEEAEELQIQVIDMSDGRVVRKIPSDEVLKMIAHLKEQMSDHVDVLA